MQLNLPIWEQVAGSKQILIAGAGGGFDVFAGLPTLRGMGKTVQLYTLRIGPPTKVTTNAEMKNL